MSHSIVIPRSAVIPAVAPLSLDYQAFTALQQVFCAAHSQQIERMENAAAAALFRRRRRLP
jgi:hypothetical protein